MLCIEVEFEMAIFGVYCLSFENERLPRKELILLEPDQSEAIVAVAPRMPN